MGRKQWAGYDWRKVEAKLNALRQFVINTDGQVLLNNG